MFPYKCVICGCEISENSIFCANCFSNLVFIDYPFCHKCGKLLDTSYSSECICEYCSKVKVEFDLARSLFLYDHFSKKIIMKIKKQADSHIAKICAEKLYAKYRELFDMADFIVPVPSHWTRIIRRGYNPPSILALELSKISNIEYKNILKRVKKTKYQKNKTFKERLANVENAFKCKINLRDKSVILADDVFTTGATLAACSRALHSVGCKNIYCITIATTHSIQSQAKSVMDEL